MPQPAPKIDNLSYGDYCQWPEEERWELIDGEAFAMAPAPTRLHQEFVVERDRGTGDPLAARRPHGGLT